MAKQDNKLDRSMIFAAANVAEKAAIAAYDWIGRGDKEAADQAAVDAMRTALNALPMRGRIVIGEGERDEAPMLYIGEEVGTGEGPEIDIALDPLEGTTPTANGMTNSLAVLAMAPRGGLLFAPDTYMDKIGVGPDLPAGVVDLDRSIEDNLTALARAKGRPVCDLTVCVLLRPRHEEVVERIRTVGARIFFITDGDVAGVISTTDPMTGIDMYIGSGGAPEGVLAAAALRCVGGQMQGRLVFRNDDERARAERTGIKDFNRKYELHDLAGGKDIVFTATGVTSGTLVDGVRKSGNVAQTHTLLLSTMEDAWRRMRGRFTI